MIASRGPRSAEERARAAIVMPAVFALADNVIDDPVAFADPHLDVSFELIEVLLRIDQMKIVPCVGTFDDHHKKIPPIVKIPVAHRRFEFVRVLFDPVP